jgi:hypothetical protein
VRHVFTLILAVLLLRAGLTCERVDVVPKHDYEKYQAALE